MPTMWKTDHVKPTPIEVECETPRYPFKDADGETIYENTHYNTIDEAWERMLNSAAIRETWGLRDLNQQREILRTKECELLTTSEAAISIRTAHAKWKEKQAEGES